MEGMGNSCSPSWFIANAASRKTAAFEALSGAQAEEISRKGRQAAKTQAVSVVLNRNQADEKKVQPRMHTDGHG
jgi:hypothetical protein